MKIILGSNSPRRKELLKQMDIEFEVRSPNVEEEIDKNLSMFEIPIDIVLQKIRSIEKFPDEIIICADTLVFLNGEPIGKPNTLAEAKAMLRRISGNTHVVITAVAIAYDNEICTFSDQSTVQFKVLEAIDIDYYVDTFKPLDKAGSYGIQEWIGAIGIERIQGSYNNVMGLPTHLLHPYLKDIKNKKGAKPL